MDVHESDWFKSVVAAIIGAASSALAFIWRQDKRITIVEQAVDKIEHGVKKSEENGERLARVETSVSTVMTTLDRLDQKIDRLMTR